MTIEKKTVAEVKKALEGEKQLHEFGAFLKTFQRDIHMKEKLLFKDNKLIVPAALQSPSMTFFHETHPKVRHEGIGKNHVVANTYTGKFTITAQTARNV